jgi:hypothetical protein
MRITIVNEDAGSLHVGVDGLFYSVAAPESFQQDVHAVQWDGVRGEIEHKDPVTGRITHNVAIESLTPFQAVLDAWSVVNTEAQAAEALRVAQRTADGLGGSELAQIDTNAG